MKIQFKKLVWEQEGCDLFCNTPLANFSIYFHQADMGEYFFVLTVNGRDVEERFRFKSPYGCKRRAQEWFEQQLTQFIETSENPAK